MTTYRVCLCFRREFKQHPTGPPQAIRNLFDLYSAGNGVMKAEQLQRFLSEVQSSPGEVTASQVVEKYGLSRNQQGKASHRRGREDGLTLDGFFRFLFSDDNLPLKASVHHDMTAPLSHYFIYTGHNSYLTGNQLSSECSDVPIIQALRRGVRVIELDMWPNSSKNDVDILHGRTLTTPVKLARCLTSIKEHAFSTSPYPVILTLEDHLTPALQAKVSEMITRTFGDLLYIPKTDFFEEFPSPEDLKMKIIISTKPPKEYLQVQVSKDNDPSKGVSDVSGEEKWGNEVPALQSEKGTQVKTELDQNEGFQDGYEFNDDDDDNDEQKLSQNSTPEYKRLISISVRKRCGVVDSFKVDPERVVRLSISEQLLEKAALSNGTGIVRFTHQSLLRIFPKTTRITSSNYNPMIGWIHGAQMVAFNMQGYGRPLWLMHGMFRANGACGYLKKPDLLLRSNEDEIFNPRADLPVKKTLKVTVYMGDGWRLDFHQTHFDTYSPPDFYTRVGIAGVPKDTIMKQTKAIENNWVPVWEEEFLFPLTVPELALLRVEVQEYDMSDKDDFGGQNCIPVSELRMGIRAVPLFDEKGEQLKSTRLLMHFEFV